MPAKDFSTRLFELLDEHRLFEEQGQTAPDEVAFESLRKDYIEFSKQRDSVLDAQLRAARPFRGYVPYGPSAYSMVCQVLWYFDQLLVRDPLEAILRKPLHDNLAPLDQTIADFPGGHLGVIRQPRSEELSDRIDQVRQVAKWLLQLRPCLDSGLLFLAGDSVLPALPELPSDSVKLLVDDAAVAEALNAALQFGLELRRGSDGTEWWVCRVDSGSAGTLTMQSRQPAAGYSPSIRFGEPLRQATRGEVIDALGMGFIEKTRDLFPQEVSRTLGLLSVAEHLSAVPVFHRDADAAIVTSAMNVLGSQVDLDPIRTFNLMLPYFDHLPPDRLVQLRLEDTTAFKNLRALFASLTDTAGIDSAAIAVEREIIPMLVEVEAEAKALGKKRLAAFGEAALPIGGLLVGAIAGVPLSPLFYGAVAITADALRRLGDVAADSERLVRNPTYFLWKAQRERTLSN